MNYCTKCGSALNVNTDTCPNCGKSANAPQKVSGFKIAAKVLMIISCIVTGLYLIPLLWTIPMTVSYSNKIKNNIEVGSGFKICTLLFVNMIAGILMLCDND